MIDGWRHRVGKWMLGCVWIPRATEPGSRWSEGSCALKLEPKETEMSYRHREQAVLGVKRI
jgi:hypothetical protein